jgi:uncharacterized repeat protein (TIGR01451 family)
MHPRRLSTVLFVVLFTLPILSVPAPVAARGPTAGADSLERSEAVEPLRVVVDPAEIRPSATGGIRTVPEGLVLPTGRAPARAPIVDPVAQLSASGVTDAPGIDSLSAPIVNVAGTTSNANPPDTTGDVGPDHYIQMNNAGPTGGQTVFQIFDKNGNDLSGGAVRFGGLWPAGTTCNSDLGDPIVVYDHIADRWLLSQFANPNQMCIAISQTPDPTANAWFLYEFNTTAFPDYPKFGVWPDGYYMSTYEGSDLGVYVFDRTNMLLGNAAAFFKDTIDSLGAAGVRDTRVLPADLDGPAPAFGTPNYFVRTVDDQQDPADPTDRVEVYEFAVDWVASSAAFTLVQTLDGGDGLAAFDIMTCNQGGGGVRDCIPQPDTTATVDALSNRPMAQLKYRLLGGDEVMVFNQTIDVAGSINPLLGFTPANEVAGIRWYELRRPGATWDIEQQGTYAAQPNGATTEAQLLHRWMGSAAIDRDGNIAVGYSITNDDDTNGQEVYPGLAYTGRRFDDLPNQMPQGEKTILAGANSQTGGLGLRWGDYSSLSVDPLDDCTFWYTNHVAGTGGTGARPTQISSFRFDTCGTDLQIGKTVEPEHPNAGEEAVYTITVDNTGSSDAENVVVTDELPAEVGYLADTDTCSGVAVGDTGTLTCELGTIPAGGSVSFQIKVLIDADLGGATSITNTASVTSDTGDTNLANNTIGLTHLVNELADVRTTKLCKPDSDPAAAGTSGVCSIFITNDGPSAAREASLTDTHVSEGTFTLGTPTASQGACLVAAAEVTCTIGTIQPGATVQVDVPVSSDEDVDVNDVALASSATPDPNLENNEATSGLSFEASADLSIAKSGPATATPGTNIVYTLSVDNLGPSIATGVVVTDELPAGVDFVSAVASVGTFSAVSGTVTWSVGNLAPSDPVQTLDITVFIQPAATGQLVNSAAVSSMTSDPDLSNNIATLTTTLDAEAGLTVTKTDTPDPVVAGDELSYTVTVGNAGPSTATDVTLTDTLPAEVSLVSAVSLDAGVTCAEILIGVVECSLGDLDPGETVTIVITVLVDPSTPDGTILTNTAAVSSPDDPDGAEATATTTVITRAEIWVEKTGEAIAGNPSGAIIFRITVHNEPGQAPDDTPTSGDGGPSDAQDVVVTDPLPLTSKKMVVQFLSPSCSYDEGAHTVTCSTATLPAGTSVTYEIQVQVKGSVGTITNTATATTSTFDPNLANNSDTVNLVHEGGTGKGKKPN